MEIGGLAMSRSIGDTVLEKVGVIATPDIKEMEILDEDKFLVMATDGVWEVINNKEVVKIGIDLIIYNPL